MQHTNKVSRGRSPRPTRRVGGAALVCGIAAIVALGGCGQPEEQSLCPAYEQLLAQQAEVSKLDLRATSSVDAAAVAEDYVESVQRLQAVSDSRYGSQLEDLEGAADDVLRTLESVPDDTDPSTWVPLVEDSVEQAADAAATVEDAIAPQCPGKGEAG